jgi:hypothetical protein
LLPGHFLIAGKQCATLFDDDELGGAAEGAHEMSFWWHRLQEPPGWQKYL